MIVIRNVHIVNEGKIYSADVLIKGDKIEKIDNSINTGKAKVLEIDGTGKYLIPGIIDDQVHFREPGLTHKATIESESAAALAGGVTSFFEQPNTIPTTTTIEEWKRKFDIASRTSAVNFAFNFGGANDNLDEVRRAIERHSRHIPGIKVFMGSSTGNMLVDDPKALEGLFQCGKLIITHCEDEAIIKENTARYKAQYGDHIPVELHPVIRNETACLKSSSLAVQLAKRFGSRLHVYHITTAEELSLFSNELPLADKMITAEACIIHLWFTADDYSQKGSWIKQNPAVKDARHKPALIQAVENGTIDVIATDHAPHTIEEKQNPYTSCPSGAPMVQHTFHASVRIFGKEKLPLIVEKACHNPAILFGVENRGFIREGYYADLVLVDMNCEPWKVSKENILYKCRWSPLKDQTFTTKVLATFVNGALKYNNMEGASDVGVFDLSTPSLPVVFTR